MGHTILLRWIYTPPPSTPLSDIILAHLLEHHRLSHPSRSTIQFRTYRQSFSSPASSSNTTASPSSTSSTPTLTAILYSHPIVQGRDGDEAESVRDDVSYLFLADRVAPSQPQAQAGLDGPANLLDDEAFEMVDSDPAGQRFPEQPEPPALSIGKGAPTYRTLAVRPAGNVLPLLHNLMSGFVLGLTKSARAAASTTSQAPTPTPLPGHAVLLTSLTFPALRHPNPRITLTIHILPNPTANTIFLEAEYAESGDIGYARAVLIDFLESCLPEEIGGYRGVVEWDTRGSQSEPEGDEVWEGIERKRRSTTLLAKCLREGEYI